MTIPLSSELPSELRAHWATAQEVSIGRSADRVFRMQLGADRVYVKVSFRGAALKGEAARLCWLAQQGMPAPTMLDMLEHDGRAWLVMTALAGADAANVQMEPDRLTTIIAHALRELHELNPTSCPFDQSLNVKLADAAENVRCAAVDEADLDDEHVGMTPQALLARAVALRPASEDIVVAHGDACLPNFIVDREALGGFVDCGRLGRADRWQDLALAARSISHNLGGEFVAPFFAVYGVERDEAKAYFYRLLDEFF